MASVSYIIRSEKKGGSEVPIWVLVRSTTLNAKTSTNLKVPFNLWDGKRQCLKPYRDKPKEVISRLDKVSFDLSNLKNYLIDIIGDREKITGSELKKYIKHYFDDKKNEKEVTQYNLNEYINIIIGQMKSGERLANGKVYSNGSIKSWNSFNKMFNTFQSDYIKRPLDFNNIDMSVYSQFIQYCYSKDYTAETTRKYITLLIAALSYGVKDGYSENRIYERTDFTKNIQKPQGKKPYLTDGEIESIFNLQLTDETQSKVRDIFLIGCYCGQRVSDYNNISKNDIIQLPNGSKAFSITQKKTNTRVVVPFLSSNIEVILQRWDYNLPKVSEVTINREIKKICRLAKITSPFIDEVIKGGQLKKMTVDKCDMITTHTARRSAITNLYKKNLLTERELRSISGHKTESSFNQYICLSTDEQAESISNKLNKN